MLGFPNSMRNGLSTGLLNWPTDNVYALAVDLGAFTPTVAMDFRDDIVAGVVAQASISGKTVGSVAVGTVDHDDAVFPSVSGPSIEQIVYVKDTGSTATSPIIIWNDAFAQVVPNGGNIGLIVPNGVWQITQGVQA